MWGSSSLSAAMLAEMVGLNRTYYVAEIDLAGMTYRFAPRGAIASSSAGTYPPFLESASGDGRHVNVERASLEQGNWSFTVYDEDRSLQKVLGGPARGDVRGSAGRGIIVSDYVEAADHYIMDQGVVVAPVTSPDRRRFTFSLSGEFSELDSEVKIPKLSRELFPQIPQEHADKPGWVLFGVFDSTGVEDTNGSIKCIPLNVPNVHLWYFQNGVGKSIDRVWVDDVLQSTSAWSTFHFIRGPYWFTAVAFTAAVDLTKTVTADGKGLTESPVPNGSTTLIENPATVARRGLAMYVYGDGKDGIISAWPSETGKPIATAFFDESEPLLTHRDTRASLQLKATDSARACVNQASNDANLMAFVTDDGKIAVRYEDPGATDIYRDENGHIIEELRDVMAGAGSIGAPTVVPISQLEVNYLSNPAGSGFSRSAIVADPTKTKIVKESLDLTTRTSALF